MLEMIRKLLGITPDITYYDDEIQMLIDAALSDLAARGVPETIATEDTADDRVTLAVSAYVKAYFGNDRTDTAEYERIVSGLSFRLGLEDGGAWDEEETDG